MFCELTVNPFSTDYYKQELNSISIKEQTFNDIKVMLKTIKGRVDGFMYKDFLIPIDNIPVLYIKNELWMSLTPMEIESHFVPIELSMGKVGVGGLGLGYFVQRILEKEDVDEVIVYELNKDIIEFYLKNFGQHEKLTIIQQDVLTLENEFFDFFYCDIYPEQMDFRAIEHMALLNSKNEISEYHFWTFENMIFEIIQAGLSHKIPFSWKITYFPFLQKLLDVKADFINLLSIGEEVFEEFEKYELL